MSDTGAGFGQATPTDSASDYNVLSFIVEQALARVGIGKVVKVMAVYDGAGNSVAGDKTGVVGPTGTIDVQIMTNQVDGANQSTPHGVIHGVPFTRSQGGGNAIICDPQVGDIGFMSISDRDISSVKKTRQISNPGSERKYDATDGVYVNPMLGGSPVQYLRWKHDGLDIVDKNSNKIETSPDGIKVTDQAGNVIDMMSSEIKITASTVRIVGNLVIEGSLNTSGPAVIDGEVTGGPSGVGLTTHVHTQGNDGHNDSEVPTDPPTPGS